MNQQSIISQINPHLNKNYAAVKKEYVIILAETAWIMSYTALWNTITFSESETSAAKDFIFNFFISSADPYKTYISFVERVLLARKYINARMNRYIPIPSQWFCEKNDKGFAGTQKWHNQLLIIRNSLPVYKIELKAMAEAVLEMREEETLSNYRYWKQYFIEHNCPDLINLFMAVVANNKWH